MRELDLHLPAATLEGMGFDLPLGGDDGADVLDVTLVSCRGQESLVAITFSAPVERALDEAGCVEWWEPVGEAGANPTYLCAVVAPDVPVAPGTAEEPVDVRAVTMEADGCTLTLVGRQAALRRRLECRDPDSPITLRRFADYDGPRDALDRLTARQREVLETAYGMGYYEVPREASADAVGRRLDLDRSTVTEHLQRAERNLLSSVLAGSRG